MLDFLRRDDRQFRSEEEATLDPSLASLQVENGRTVDFSVAHLSR